MELCGFPNQSKYYACPGQQKRGVHKRKKAENGGAHVTGTMDGDARLWLQTIIANPTPCLLLATFYDRLIRGGSSGENPRGKSETENISDFAWLFWKRRVSVLANCKQHLYTKIGKYLEKNHCQHAGNT